MYRMRFVTCVNLDIMLDNLCLEFPSIYCKGHRAFEGYSTPSYSSDTKNSHDPLGYALCLFPYSVN